MLSLFEELEKYDAIWFLPVEENEDAVKITTNEYDDSGVPVDVGFMGDTWHILLFRPSEENEDEETDFFEGVLLDPRVYVTELIRQGWYGVVARKTTTSKKFVDRIVEAIKVDAIKKM